MRYHVSGNTPALRDGDTVGFGPSADVVQVCTGCRLVGRFPAYRRVQNQIWDEDDVRPPAFLRQGSKEVHHFSDMLYAQIDGEDFGVERESLDEHLEGPSDFADETVAMQNTTPSEWSLLSAVSKLDFHLSLSV